MRIPLPTKFFSVGSPLVPVTCGGFTFVVTNAFYTQFGLPKAWVALVLSGLLGLVVAVQQKKDRLWHRAIIFPFNVLLIWGLAIGTNTTLDAVTGHGATQQDKALPPSQPAQRRFLDPYFPRHGGAIFKSCTARPTGESSLVHCTILVVNKDGFGDALRVNSIVDVVHRYSGEETSPNLLPNGAPFTLRGRDATVSVTHEYAVRVSDANEGKLTDIARADGIDEGTGMPFTLNAGQVTQLR